MRISSPAARLVIPALRWSAESGFGHEEPAIERALAAGVGGFIVFGGTPETVKALVDSVLARANRPLLIGADLERGAGQQVSGLTEFPPPRALASLEDPGVIRGAARTTAVEARSVGINWVFAPVADLDCVATNPIVQSRSFGPDPEEVSRNVRLWVESCQTAGALACVKHYPGHGRTTVDSHAELPVVEASRETLMREDERPFRVAVEAGVAAVMTAHVAFPSLDPSGLPATFSSMIIGRLRQALRFDGLVVTDAMIMEGARQPKSETEGAVEIVRAGCDLLLYPRDPVAVAQALERAADSGALAEGRLTQALGRYERALVRAARGAKPVSSGPGQSAEIADRLLAWGLARGAAEIRLRLPLEIAVVDDDVGGPYTPQPDGVIPRDLPAAGVPVGPGGSCVVLVFAEPRGWKGRAGLSESSRAALTELAPRSDLVILFGHPRLVEEVPGDAPLLVAWHRQALMQAAVVRWLKLHVASS